MFLIVLVLLMVVGFFQSWTLALMILNMCIISAIMSLGVNIQWGYAGLFNLGIMGFVALGGLAVVITSAPPINEAWSVGGLRVIFSFIFAFITILSAIFSWNKIKSRRTRNITVTLILVCGFFIYRFIFDPAIVAIEKINPASEGYLGGMGLPVLLSWPVGALLAAGAAWVVGKISLGLRSDYLAIATLAISEVIIFILKNEDWLSRGVKNVIGLPRPVPYEINLQKNDDFILWSEKLGINLIDASSMFVKGCYTILFLIVLVFFFWLFQRALNSPWGRMMRAIRDNETSAEAMGKNVTYRHLQVFILGSAICGFAGAMMTTLDGQLTPTSYQPLRFTFLIWVMVIVGGSGNNLGSIFGGFLIWFFWIEVEPMGVWFMEFITLGFSEDNPFRIHMIESAAYMRYLTMGVILLLMLLFNPKDLIPEK